MATQNFQAIGPVAQLLLGKFSLLYLNSKILDKKSSHLLPLQLQQEVTLDNLINEIGLKCPVQEIILHFVFSKFIFPRSRRFLADVKIFWSRKKNCRISPILILNLWQPPTNCFPIFCFFSPESQKETLLLKLFETILISNAGLSNVGSHFWALY